MAPLGLSALRSRLSRGSSGKGWQPPEASWSRSFGLGWQTPFTVRYASNLDDGPWHGMPLGGFGAGCIGRSSRGDFNLWQVWMKRTPYYTGTQTNENFADGKKKGKKK